MAMAMAMVMAMAMLPSLYTCVGATDYSDETSQLGQAKLSWVWSHYRIWIVPGLATAMPP